MSEEKKCPICHHFIIEPNRGTQGSAGKDEDEQPKPFWTDDPLLTPKGLGATEWDENLIAINWTGIDKVKASIHIKELQDYYKEQEEKLLLEANRTEWEEVEPDENEPKIFVKRIHIEQLRTSVEKLLLEIGLTLEDYFKFDYLGEEIELPYTRYGIEINEHQTNWTDPDLQGKLIKAIHIEELRRGLMLFWIETWDSARIISGEDWVLSDSISKVAPADFHYPPPNVNAKTYIAPNKILMADNEWEVTGHRVWFSGDYNYRYTYAIFNSEWSVEGQSGNDKFLDYKGSIENLHWSTGKYQAIALTEINFITYPNFVCNKNSQFKITDFNYEIDCSYDTVINAEQYCWFDCWNTVEELTKSIGDGLDETVIEIKIYFDNYFYYWGFSWWNWHWIKTPAYISYYVSSPAFEFAQGITHYPATKLAILIGSGNINRSVFDDVKTLYHNKADTAMDVNGNTFDITEDNFDWKINKIVIHARGKIHTESVGWLSVGGGGTWGVAGYTNNVCMDANFSIDKLMLINKSTS